MRSWSEMGSKWKKAKLALGLNLCVFVPRTLDDMDSPPATEISERLSDAALLSPSRSATPVASSHGFKLSKSASKSSKVRLFLHLFCFSFSYCFCFWVVLLTSMIFL